MLAQKGITFVHLSCFLWVKLKSDTEQTNEAWSRLWGASWYRYQADPSIKYQLWNLHLINRDVRPAETDIKVIDKRILRGTFPIKYVHLIATKRPSCIRLIYLTINQNFRMFLFCFNWLVYLLASFIKIYWDRSVSSKLIKQTE